ncbi:DegQ family serine endoprotease [Granulibacter bethesdensis]|uniref:DegQ family serine endoprotease n=1 Tax=Granulibacter bethesdensis TaxID=364410 RepID=UPI0003F2003A|nr:DegQ family serine endoprotease [Granulibacter bethesdensis]AHJ68686.1 Endopeptidase degP [Granulibacter bethesdensis]
MTYPTPLQTESHPADKALQRRSRCLRAGLALAAMIPLATGLVPGGLPLYPAMDAQAREAPASFADLAEKLLPGVVNISSTTTIARGPEGPGPDMPQFPPGSPFEKFFRDFMNRHPLPGQPHGGEEGAPRRAQSLGSGFIVDAKEGIVVTNNHVIDGADEITVILQDNTPLKAKVLGRDERLDIAVLQVTPPKDKPLTAVQFGDSDKERVGDWVLAIGNPFGLGGSVTAGIVSARGRDIHQGPYDDFIQTDAAINRGNSGGPLFNMDGQVIGINTAIYSPSGGSIGIGFAIPSRLAQNVVDQIRKFGRARRGWLGVRIQQVTPEIAESLGLKETNGAMIAGVNEGGPADKAHLQNGDIILKFNNQDVKDMHSLPRIVAETPIDETVPVVVWRGGKRVTLDARVGEMPDDVKQAAAEKAKPGSSNSAQLVIRELGVTVTALSPEVREHFNLQGDQKGVVIANIASGSAAEQRGLKPGDIIVEVQQEPVAAPKDITQRLEAVRKQGRKSVLLLIQGQDGLRWVPLPLS